MERSKSLLQVARTYYIASQDDMQDMNWTLLLNSYSMSKAEVQSELAAPNAILLNLIIEKDNDASVANNIARARENARAVQDNITKEVWQSLNDYYHHIRDSQIKRQLNTGDPVTVLDTLLRDCMLYYGTVDTTMARGEEFNFLNIGKFLERAVQTIYLLQMKLHAGREATESAENTSWRYLLYSLTGYQLYLKTYRGNIQPRLVAQHVMHNIAFPHSVLYSIQQLHRYFARLQADSLEESFQQMDFCIGKAIHLIRYSNILEMEREELAQLLISIQGSLLQIANDFNEYYFGLNY